MYLSIEEESVKNLFKRVFFIGGKFTSIMKSWESYDPVKIGLMTLFLLT